MGVLGASGKDSRLSPALRGVLVLLFLSVFVNYIDRSNLSIAAPMLKDELGISAAQLGWLLSAFFWTYASTQIFTGWLVDRLDAKWVLAAGFAVWSCATAVTGLLHGFTMFFVLRVVLGIGESVAYPAYSKIIARLYVEHQRGIANALISAGLAMGPGVGLLVGGPLMAKYGWRPFFLVLGSAALLWLIPWVWWMPSLPGAPSRSPGPGFAEIIRHRPLWATSLCLFCANYGLYFTVTWLPFYLVRERGFTMRQMAWVGAAYFFALALSTAICGKLADRLIEAGHTPSRVRKACMIIALSFTGVFFALSVFLPRPLGVVCLLLAGIATGPGASNVFAIAQRLAGLQAVGRWTGIQLFCGNMSGVVVSAVTGYLVQHSGHFTSAFLVVTAVLWVGAITWSFGVGPIEPVPWSQAELIETFEPTVHAS